jgi:acetyl-CoA acetyltransferase
LILWILVLGMGSDGAAALVLVSGAKARALGLHVIAKLRGYADAAQVCWIHQPATTF